MARASVRDRRRRSDRRRRRRGGPPRGRAAQRTRGADARGGAGSAPIARRRRGAGRRAARRLRRTLRDCRRPDPRARRGLRGASGVPLERRGQRGVPRRDGRIRMDHGALLRGGCVALSRRSVEDRVGRRDPSRRYPRVERRRRLRLDHGRGAPGVWDARVLVEAGVRALVRRVRRARAAAHNRFWGGPSSRSRSSAPSMFPPR